MAHSSLDVRYLILGLLAQHPMSGYDVRRFLKARSWLISTPSFGSIYPALRALEQDGLVTVDVLSRPDRPPRKSYSITEAGRRTLQVWAEQSAGPGAPLKAFLMRLILADSLSQAGLVAHLTERRSQVAAHQATIEDSHSSVEGGGDLGRRLTHSYELALAAAELAWLDRTLSELSGQ